MNDTMITVVGNVVDSPRFVRLKDSCVTNFRIASTARRFDSRTQTFVDSRTLWIDVECWNELGSHVSGSVSKGDPVIVHGEIGTHSWETDAGRRSRPQIRARAVGHNLTWGTSAFTRIRPARPAAGGEEAAEEGLVGDPADEAYADGVDPFTGEVVDETDETEESDGIRAGRDYVVGDVALEDGTTDGRSLQPAHA